MLIYALVAPCVGDSTAGCYCSVTRDDAENYDKGNFFCLLRLSREQVSSSATGAVHLWSVDGTGWICMGEIG